MQPTDPTTPPPAAPTPPAPIQPSPAVVTPSVAQPTVIAPPPPDTIAQIAAQHDLSTPVDQQAVYATICTQIVKEQAQIIGALSYEQASQVPGLAVDPKTYECTIHGDGNQVLEALVDKYREFFGNAAVEVCREAALRFASRLPTGQLPGLLRS